MTDDRGRAVDPGLLIDVTGLCVAARATDYVKAALAAWPDSGAATVIGHVEPLSAARAREMAIAAIFMPQLCSAALRRSWGAEGGEQPPGLRFWL